MSFIYNNSVKYSDSPNLDAFGRLRVSQITSLVEVTHVYDKRPEIVDEVTGGTILSSADTTNARIVMSGTGANSYVIRQTFQSAVYQPGKSQLMEASFSNFQLQSNVIKRVGAFTTTTASTYNSNIDGYFLESNGITNKISFQVWKTGTLTYSADTSAWDSSEVNPSSIDWSKSNLMLVDYQWLGVGRIRFGMVLSGLTYYFYENCGTNNLTNVYMSSPTKPIRYELRTSGGTGSLDMICSQISMEGSLNQLVNTLGIVTPNSGSTFSTANTKYAFLGIKMNTGYENISPLLRQIDIINTSNDDYFCTVEISPTISGSYSFTASTQPEVLYSVGNGTQTISTSGTIIGTFVGEAGTSAKSSFQLIDSQLVPGKKINGTAQELWVCVTPLGANATFNGSINLEYRK